MERARALRRSERGWTLVEMLVAVTIGMVVLGGAVTIFMGAVKSEPRATAKVSAIQEGRVALERITREVRQGVAVVDASQPNRLVLITYVNQSPCGGAASGTAIPCQVTYDCAADACTRVVAAPNGTAPGLETEVVSDLSSTAVFSWSESEPDSVEVQLAFEKSQSTDPTVLADGATLRGGGSS